MDKRIVTVFGGSQTAPLEGLYQSAYQIGRAVADAGWTICNGGYGGTMEAAARGAAEQGGKTIGVTCTRFSRGGPNQFIQHEIPTFDLLQRLNTLIRLGRAYIVLPGGTGTLTELALAWELLNKRLLTGARPIILYGEHWRSVVDCITSTQPSALELLQADSPDSIVEILNRLDI